jgi:hypothetical protein
LEVPSRRLVDHRDLDIKECEAVGTGEPACDEAAFADAIRVNVRSQLPDLADLAKGGVLVVLGRWAKHPSAPTPDNVVAVLDVELEVVVQSHGLSLSSP